MLSVMNFTSRCIVMIFQSGGTSGKLKMRVGKKGPRIICSHICFLMFFTMETSHINSVPEQDGQVLKGFITASPPENSLVLINSIIIIVLLMGLLALLIVRHLKNDMKKFSNNDEEEDREVGWKYIHGDVFRYTPSMSLFCAVLGVGTQLLAMLFILFLLAFFGVLYPYNRGALFTARVFICTTTIIGGYTSAAFHNQFSVTGWVLFLVIFF